MSNDRASERVPSPRGGAPLPGDGGHIGRLHSVPHADGIPRRTLAATSESATLVFIRPVHTGVREGHIITIVDGRGNFLGQLNDGDHFAVQLVPGHRQIIGFFWDKADLLQADLVAAEIYYVEVTAVPEGWYARATLRALHPIPGTRARVQELLDETRQLVPLVRQAWRELDREELRRKIGNAQQRWEHYTLDERAAERSRRKTGCPRRPRLHGSTRPPVSYWRRQRRRLEERIGLRAAFDLHRDEVSPEVEAELTRPPPRRPGR